LLKQGKEMQPKLTLCTYKVWIIIWCSIASLNVEKQFKHNNTGSLKWNFSFAVIQMQSHVRKHA
jgi:hypothetical protein